MSIRKRGKSGDARLAHADAIAAANALAAADADAIASDLATACAAAAAYAVASALADATAAANATANALASACANATAAAYAPASAIANVTAAADAYAYAPASANAFAYAIATAHATAAAYAIASACANASAAAYAPASAGAYAPATAYADADAPVSACANAAAAAYAPALATANAPANAAADVMTLFRLSADRSALVPVNKGAQDAIANLTPGESIPVKLPETPEHRDLRKHIFLILSRVAQAIGTTTEELRTVMLVRTGRCRILQIPDVVALPPGAPTTVVVVDSMARQSMNYDDLLAFYLDMRDVVEQMLPGIGDPDRSELTEILNAR